MNLPKKTTAKKVASIKKERKIFPIVAIGASAGGLEAVTELLKNLPNNTGMAFIFVQHLSSQHKSMLTTLLAKVTKMQVQKIEDMELIKPNNVYVIPNDKGIEVTDGHIKLIPRLKNISTLSIDILFSSLAKTHKENVIGIILSGNANDGTRGLKAIKQAGGITFAQDDTAKNASMPTSAIHEGVVDYVLSPKEIAKKLIKLSKNNSVRKISNPTTKEYIIQENDPHFNTIFRILDKGHGVDFSHYKMSTIKRRIHRRLIKNNIKTIKDYVKILSTDRKETEMLHADLLINVTSFFRDTETFRYLKNTSLPKLLKEKKPNETLRIWVPACSTGEEAYSIAMLITEIQDTQTIKIPVQIFATDLSEQVIKEARIGEYSKKELKHFSASRVKRFFIKKGDNFCIVKELRKMCVFATHNILRDPPFIHIDLISCRNLLIYFDTAAQKKVMSSFHFALKEGGYLLLGKSETIVTPQLFNKLNNKYNIFFSKQNSDIKKIPELEPRSPKQAVPMAKIIQTNNAKFSRLEKNTGTANTILDTEIDSILLSQFMPACAVINMNMDILQFRGSTALFLSHPSGKASLNILKMAKPEIIFDLQVTIQKVFKTKHAVTKTDIEMKVDTSFKKFSLEVSPLKVEWDEPLLLVVFNLQETVEKENDKLDTSKNNTVQTRKIKKLTEELNTVRTEMQSLLEFREQAIEQLQAANEEIVSSNEEFQTLNEELETSKEEIEASNEELISTNQELQMQNDLLTESYNYSEAIFSTIHEPMLILHKNLHIKSASKSFYKKFLTTKEETEGASLFELGNKQWNIPKLRELLDAVLSKNSRFENFEVTHVFPGMGEKIILLNASRIIQKTHREKLILLAFEDITERSIRQQKMDGKNRDDIRVHEENKLGLENEVKGRTTQLLLKNIELETANKKLAFQNNEKEKRAAELEIANVELAFQNNEKERRAEELSIANQDLTSFTYISSHDLQEPLRKIQTFINCIHNEKETLSDKSVIYFQRITKTAKRMQQLIEDLLTYSRTKSNERVFENTDLNLLISDIKKDFEGVIFEEKVVIETVDLCEIKVIHFQFRQLLHNLISNSIKFSKPNMQSRILIKSKIAVFGKLNKLKLMPEKKYFHITYIDNGIGFDEQYRDRIFEVFQRLHSAEEYSGTGIGLAICKRIVENHNGTITATGKLGQGAQFDIYIPVE